MARLGRRQHRGDGFGIAHFPHQDHVGILPQDTPQRPREIRCVLADLDLFDHRLPVPVYEFDGIFDGHHMIAAMRVNQVDQRGQRRALAAARGPCDQDQALARLGESAERRGQMQRFERRDFFRKQADAARHRSALVMDIGAKAPDALAAETQVDGLGALQFVALRLRKQRQQKIPRLVALERRTRSDQRTRDPQRNRRAAISNKSEAPRRTACASN